MIERAFFPKNPDEGESDEGDHQEDDRRPSRSISETEGHALVVDANQIEEVIHHHDACAGFDPWRLEGADGPELRDLVEHVERQCKEEEEFGECHHGICG